MSKKQRNRQSRESQPKAPFVIPSAAFYEGDDPAPFEFKPYEPPPGVIPKDKKGDALAQDSTPYATLNSNEALCSLYGGFRGYPYLAMLSQATEYANAHAVIADEMTRAWIKITSSDEDEKIVEEVEDLIKKYKVKELIHNAIFQDSMFGVARIYIDTGADDNEKLNPLFKDPRKVKGKLKANSFKLVEPMWVYPAMYNSADPLSDNFYCPDAWFVMGKTVHSSRFINLVTRPVAQILKPSYNFGGLSLTQLMESYVNSWEEIRKEIPEIVKAFTLAGLKTDMEARMQNPALFKKRIELMANYKTNRGVLAIDKEEEYFQVNTPMTDLEKIATNYQEQLCIPSRVPVIKLLGNAPAGLSASGDGEIEVWHETVAGIQERNIRPLLQDMLDYIMLSEWGEIKEEISFEFNPLTEMTDEQHSDIRLKNAQQLNTLAMSGAIQPSDANQWLVNDPISGFSFLKGIEHEDREEDEEDEEDA
jgi:uncharacterized protein